MIIMIANSKGGVGKSTSALCLAQLSKEKTCLVDTEGNLMAFYQAPRGAVSHVVSENLSIALSFPPSPYPTVIIDTRPEWKAIKQFSKLADIVLIPCSMEIAALEEALKTIEVINKTRAYILPTMYKWFMKTDRAILKEIHNNAGIPVLSPIRFILTANEITFHGMEVKHKGLLRDYRRVYEEYSQADS